MAGWYRTGTVNLTNGSATVAGIGATLWANALRPGMVFTTDFHTLYEIKTVDGDAQITLDRAWAGGTVVGVAYAVIFGGAAISNAEVVAELMTMVGKWQTREDQYDDWVAGQPDGGPNGDGKYPLTDSKGVTRLITSPGRLLILIDNGLLDNVQQVVDMIEDDIAAAQQAADQATAAATTLTAYVTSADQDRQAAEAARDAVLDAKGAAATSEGNAKASETAAGNSAVTANTAATTATGARDATLTAKTATEQARDTTLTARDTTLAARDVTTAARDVTTQARDQATAAQTNAAVSAGQAADAKTTAINAAADSVDAKIHAVAAQVVAEQRRNEAADSATLAKAWASNPVGQPVASGALSAYHWAEQARTAAQTAQVIAGGYMFGVVGDGNSGRINAQAAADTLHLVPGAGMNITYDNATRKVVFSSQARAVASEDPAITVRLDETAALAYLGLDESKISHQALIGAGTRSHAEIDTHIANSGIHVPAPGSGDTDKLLKATGAGTFAWVKGTGSGIDADKLDGLSWEEGVEVGNNAGTADWVKLGRWDAQTTVGRRLLITAAGGYGYGQSDNLASGGITWVTAYSGDNSNTAAGNAEGRFSYLGASMFTAVKLVQVGSNRFQYDVYVNRVEWSPFNFRVQCNGTWTTAVATGQASPGNASATVADMAALGQIMTSANIDQNGSGNTLVQRRFDGSISGSYAYFAGGGPAIVLEETDATANNKMWRTIVDGQVLSFQTVADGWASTANWLEVSRNGATPTEAKFKAQVKTSLSALGTATGNSVQHTELYSSTGNNDFLRTKLVRLANNTNWSSATWRIQRTVDADDQGFVQIGLGAAENYSVGVGLGYASTVRLWVPSGSADVTIDNNKIWHAGNFDPASKAGTAVATVGANGLMSAADKQALNAATSSATANALVARDGNAWAAFAGVTLGGNAALHAGNNGSAKPTLAAINLSSGYTNVRFNDTDGATGLKFANFDYENGRFALQALDDNGAWVRDNLLVWADGRVEAQSGDVSSRTWATMSGASNGDAVFGSNLYFDVNNVPRAKQTHGSIGSRGILFNWPSWGDISVVNYSGATTANQDLSGQTAYKLMHTGNMSGITPTFAGANMTGALSLASSWGTNYFGTGTGDGADYSTYNFKLQGWWGMGLASYDGTVHGNYDFRSGRWDVHGGYYHTPISDFTANNPAFWAGPGAMTPGTYNMAFRADNNAGQRLIAFVNGTTRNTDGPANSATIRNDGGTLILGAVAQPTVLYGSSVTVNGNRAVDVSTAAMPARNLAHNPRFRIAQRGIGPWTGGQIGPDRWGTYWAGTMVAQHRVLARSTEAGANWYDVVINTPQTSLGANDFVVMQHKVENIDTSRLNWGTAQAKAITTSFRCYSSVAGRFFLTVRNDWNYYTASASRYSYIVPFDVVVGEQTITLTIPGPTTGRSSYWLSPNVGFELCWFLAAGSAQVTSSVNQWVSGTLNVGTGGTNFAAGVNEFAVSDITVEEGGLATPISAMERPYDEEVRLCRRFYQEVPVGIRSYAAAAMTYYSYVVTLPVPMRAAPSLVLTTPSGASAVNAYSESVGNVPVGGHAAFRYEMIAGAVGDNYVLGRVILCSVDI